MRRKRRLKVERSLNPASKAIAEMLSSVRRSRTAARCSRVCNTYWCGVMAIHARGVLDAIESAKQPVNRLRRQLASPALHEGRGLAAIVGCKLLPVLS